MKKKPNASAKETPSLIIAGYLVSYSAHTDEYLSIQGALSSDKHQSPSVSITSPGLGTPFNLEPEAAKDFGKAIEGMLKLPPCKVVAVDSGTRELRACYEDGTCRLNFRRSVDGYSESICCTLLPSSALGGFARHLIAAADHAEALYEQENGGAR